MNRLSFTEILNVNINILTLPITVDYLDTHLEELRGEYICVSNVHTTVTAFRDEEYRKVQNGSVLNLPDGKPLSITQKKMGYTQAGRVPGPDLMPLIWKLSEERGYRHYFYGSTQETLDLLKKNLEERYPKLQIAGMYSPPFRPLTEEEDAQDIEMINSSKPDFVWVGLGAPKQEKWMSAHQGKINAVMLGVGAGFDFHAGTVKRAPKWMQELCIEWLWRMLQDPKRLLPRYLSTNSAYIVNVYKELKRKKKEALKKWKAEGKLKISMIGHKRIPSREGGVEIVVEELSTRMVKLGHRVDAYNRSGYHVSGKQFDEKHGKIYEGVRLYKIPTLKSSSFNAIVYSIFATILATARSAFRKNHVIHFHAEGPCIMLWLPKLFGIRTVATIHGLDWQRAKWGGFATRMLKFGEKVAAKYADEVIVLSKNVQQYFKDTYGRDVKYIPNGISKPDLREPDDIKRLYGLEKGEYILFLARLVPEKGAHYLVNAFKKIDTNKKMVIAGGESHSQEYMESLRKMCADDERIIMTGFVQGRTLEELYSNAYLFVLPSDVEGMSISLLEAMSYNNACLVSDIEENIEVVEDKAFNFKHSDENDLRDELKKLLANPQLIEEKKVVAGDFIVGKYDWNKVVEETLKTYVK